MARLINNKKPKDLSKTISNLLGYLFKQKWLLIVVTLLVFISTIANLLGTYLIRPIINDYILPKDINGLIKILIILGIIYGIGVIATYLYNQLMVKIAQKTVKVIRTDLFEKVQKLPLEFFDSRSHGELMSRFTNDIDVIQEALNNSFTMIIQSFIMIVGTIIIIVLLNLQLSLIVLGSLIMMVIFINYSSRKSKHYFKEQQQNIGKLNGFIEEMVEGQKVVKVFNHEEANMQHFEQKNEELRLASTKALTYSGTIVPVVVSISYLNYALSAIVGGLFAVSGLMDIGGLATYLVYVRQVAMPVNQFSQQINFILAALSGAERIFEIINEQPEIDEGDVTLTSVTSNQVGTLSECKENTGNWAWRHYRQDGSIELVPLAGDVRFNHVNFGYKLGQNILSNIELKAKPGEKIAFVGSTGAGKTTITNLINRFYDVSSGSITYDGIDIKLIKKDDLRKSLSMVLQDTHLFTGTIFDNIRYGRLDASDKEVIEAAFLANADSFIKRLPQGYETMLESDGANLSQGQRQLLAIARAAIANPPVLILDEATSSIDTRTEKLIEKGMDKLMENRTVFVIAHRLSTIRNADKIVVLDKGKVIEQGNHEELLKQKGFYYKLYMGQFKLS